MIGERKGRNLILSLLPGTYSGFILNFHMNKMQSSYEDLHNMLRTAEQDIKLGNPSLFVQSGQSTSKASGKSKKVKKGKKKISKKDSKKPSKPKSDRPKVPKDQCLHCSKPGHWKRDCPDLKGKDGTSGIFSIFPIIIDISLALNECS